MIGARRRALTYGLTGVIAAAALAYAAMRSEPRPLAARAPAERPALMLLTSLPLMFSEDFSLSGGSPALKRLQGRYRVVPISVTSPAELAKGRLLLMAQPLAQTAENLVALDDWVRRGGRVIILADPLLEWPSKRPLGDPLRPPPMFADTGLLGHWGLRLDAPNVPGTAVRMLAGYRVITVSPGVLYGRCRISRDRLVADCRVGKGDAVVVADADFIGSDKIGSGASHNLDALIATLANLEPK
jgi:hypothetical protein